MLKKICMIMYVIFLLYIVWLMPGEVKSDAMINIVPLETIRLYVFAFIHGHVSISIVFGNLIGNIVFFIPIGVLLYRYLRHMGKAELLFFSFYIPVYIEAVQFLLHLIGYHTRSVDIDDVLLNMIGIWIAYFFSSVWTNRRAGR